MRRFAMCAVTSRCVTVPATSALIAATRWVAREQTPSAPKTSTGRGDPCRLGSLMIRARPYRRLSLLCILISLPLLVMGCPKKEPPPVEDAGAPPPASTPSVTELAPLTDTVDASDAAAEAGPKKWNGPGLNQNQLKIEACCNAMR